MNKIYVVSGKADIDGGVRMASLNPSKRSYIPLCHPCSKNHPNSTIVVAKSYNRETKLDLIIYTYSPYMVEALARYIDKDRFEALYFDGYKLIKNNALSKIFESLAEPFDEFRKQDRELLDV